MEDVAKMDGDDPGDAARYGPKGRFGRIQKPASERAAQVVASTDPSIRAIQAAKETLRLGKVGIDPSP
jgi:hypothetical protein